MGVVFEAVKGEVGLGVVGGKGEVDGEVASLFEGAAVLAAGTVDEEAVEVGVGEHDVVEAGFGGAGLVVANQSVGPTDVAGTGGAGDEGGVGGFGGVDAAPVDVGGVGAVGDVDGEAEGHMGVVVFGVVDAVGVDGVGGAVAADDAEAAVVAGRVVEREVEAVVGVVEVEEDGGVDGVDAAGGGGVVDADGVGVVVAREVPGGVPGPGQGVAVAAVVALKRRSGAFWARLLRLWFSKVQRALTEVLAWSMRRAPCMSVKLQRLGWSQDVVLTVCVWVKASVLGSVERLKVVVLQFELGPSPSQVVTLK